MVVLNTDNAAPATSLTALDPATAANTATTQTQAAPATQPAETDTATISTAGSNAAALAAPSAGAGGLDLSQLLQALSAASYFSVEIGGTQYAGTISSSGGVYTATAAGVSGVAGTGENDIDAENALEMRLSAMA